MTKHRRAFAVAAIAVVASTLSARSRAADLSDASPSASDALLGETFTNHVEGVQLRPPIGGTKVRQIGNGEVIRFVYPEQDWKLTLKTAPNSTRLPLAGLPDAPPHQQGLLDLAAVQLTDRPAEPAKLLRKEVTQAGPNRVGLIEAHDNAGIDRFFVQLAIVPAGSTRTVLLQMVSPADDAKGANGQGPQPGREAAARQAFNRTLATLTLLDRGQFREEQKRRWFNTLNFWAQLDRKRIEPALRPRVRLMRVVRDGKTVGYLQVDQRPDQHQGRDGFTVVARSHVEQQVVPTAPMETATPPAGPTVDLPKPAGAATAAPVPTLVQTDRDARFFCTFDRLHEDWTTLTRYGDQPGRDDLEMGSSDQELRRALDHDLLDQQHQVDAVVTGSGKRADRQAPVMTKEQRMLRVDAYRARVRVGKPFETQIDPQYLPQAVAQLLPQLLPADHPNQYMFAFYSSDQHELLRRYVDVGTERAVTLDGHPVRAVPIADRIGADGADTVHYVSRTDGEWFGTVSDDGHLLVLPSDEGEIQETFKRFKTLPPPTDADAARQRPAGADATPPPPAAAPKSTRRR